MHVFKSKLFDRFAQRERIADRTLRAVAAAVVACEFDADLGGGVFKMRVARAGSGKSGGYRTLLICARAGFVVFQHGFAKSEKGNVSVVELRALKLLARAFDAMSLADAAASRALIEVVEYEED